MTYQRVWNDDAQDYDAISDNPAICLDCGMEYDFDEAPLRCEECGGGIVETEEAGEA